MTERMRRPALASPPIQPAVEHAEIPDAFLHSHYEQVWRTRMHDMPFVNPTLAVEAIGFSRHEGDWLGVVVTPWFLNLFLLYGGGNLWQDVAAGQRRPVQLPCGTLQFIADNDPDIGVYQYCPLIASMAEMPDAATARQTALDALQAVLTPSVPEPAGETKVSVPSVNSADGIEASRRSFFRRLAGRT